MVSKMNWKSWVILGAAVALFVASGGLLMASNMGFKLNTPLTPNFKAPGPQGRQWRALPWNSPYTNMTAVCNALVAAGGAAGNLQLTVLDAATGINTNRLCNLVSPNPAIDGRIGLQIRVIAPLSGPPNLPANLVIVGSSNESLLLPVMKGNFKAPGPQFLNWFAPPYHTT